MSEILPPGVRLLDAPHPFGNAIKSALTYLSWQDNLSKEDLPPKRIWLDDKKLQQHFKDVEKRREDEMKGKNNTEEGWDGPMEKNAAAKLLIVGD